MIYTPLTSKAMTIAYNTHHGQFDQCGVPYVFHPLHLAEQMDDEVSCCVALLHDVVEDTSVTLEQLQKEFPESVTIAIALLTHSDDQDYYEYVRAIKENPVAKKVKLADLAHNSDQRRCVGIEIPAEKLEFWKQKYDKARQILLDD